MKVGIEENDDCNRDGCIGIMEYPPSDNCSCHISPPCAECVSKKLMCSECGFEVEDSHDK